MDLCEDVYMKVPQGSEGVGENKVCKLVKSLYSIKHASKKWYDKISQFLTLAGFSQVTLDPIFIN